MTDTVTINGKVVDLKKCLPVTMGTMRKLQKAGIDVTEASKKGGDFEWQMLYCLIILQKANPDLSIEDFDVLTSGQFVEIVKRLNEQEPTNRPLESGATT